MKDNQDEFEVLRHIYKKPDSSQRELAENLGFSLGKLNYCIKALKNKGLLKIENFKRKDNKIKHLQYIITPKGISERTKNDYKFYEKENGRIRQFKKRIK